MMFEFNKKLNGSTILEVLIAMAILTVCSSLAVVVYLNIQKSSLPFFKLIAVELAEQNLIEAVAQKNYTDGTTQVEEFQVKRSVVANEAYPDCYLIRVLIFDGKKKKIAEIEQSVFKGN